MTEIAREWRETLKGRYGLEDGDPLWAMLELQQQQGESISQQLLDIENSLASDQLNPEVKQLKSLKGEIGALVASIAPIMRWTRSRIWWRGAAIAVLLPLLLLSASFNAYYFLDGVSVVVEGDEFIVHIESDGRSLIDAEEGPHGYQLRFK